ncbi:MAG: hypothetical protein NVS3B20_17270 [Polyangiales bacterium]
MLAVCSFGCGRQRVEIPRAPHLQRGQLHDAHALDPNQLTSLARAPQVAFREELNIALRDPLSGRGFEGRGVVVVRPQQALRMILLGPGGATVMDVWIRGARFRVAIPPLDRVVRGDTSTGAATMRGLPVALLWRWLVVPFEGTVLALHAGHIDTQGNVVETMADVGAKGGETSITPDTPNQDFVAFLRRGRSFEVRSREHMGDRMIARAWWFERGVISAFIVGEERSVEVSEGATAAAKPILPVDATYVSLDPPMTVRVHANTIALLPTEAELPEATFADPDAQ